MFKYIPAEVYVHTAKFFEYRGVTNKHTYITTDEFVKQLFQKQFYVVEGERDDTKHLICIVAPQSESSNKIAQFKKLYTLLATTYGISKQPTTIVFLTPTPFTKFIDAAVAEERAKQPNLQIEQYEYTMLSIVVPEHKDVPTHKILTAEERSSVLEFQRTQASYLPQISQRDPMAVWLGAKPGDVMRVDRESEDAGRAIAYRFVTK
jgi:DNA-directed RNA polymerase subunit H